MKRLGLVTKLAIYGAIVLGLLGCGVHRPVDADWHSTAGYQVLRMRWVKKLNPSLPNFLIPELAEEHDRFNPVETSAAGFDTDRKRAFIGAAVGGLYCVELVHGKTIWRFDLADPVGSTPIYDATRKRVFFGADNGNVYAVHARSGRQIWEQDTGAEVRRKPILQSETLYVANADNSVLALDPDSGEIIWQYRRPPIEGFSAAGHAGLTYAKNKLFTGFSDGYIAALDPVGGTVVWSHDLAAEVTAVAQDGTVRLSDADATPTVVGNVLVAASVDGGLMGLDLNSGTVLWTRPELIGTTGLAADQEFVYAARSSFGLSAVDPKTGDTVWTKRFPTGVLLDPVMHDDVMLISDSMFGLYVVSTADGSLLQRLDPREGFFAPPSLHAGYMLILGNSGTLMAMSIL